MVDPNAANRARKPAAKPQPQVQKVVVSRLIDKIRSI
jgi:hypothetical protein